MLFNNYKAVISTLYYLLGEDNFAITGSLADYKHLEKDVVINDIDLIIVNEKILENLNPYFKMVRTREIEDSNIPHIKRVYVYNILYIKVEIFVNKVFKEVEKMPFLNMSLNIINRNGRKKELLDFIELSTKQEDKDRIKKYTKMLNRYK